MNRLCTIALAVLVLGTGGLLACHATAGAAPRRAERGKAKARKSGEATARRRPPPRKAAGAASPPSRPAAEPPADDADAPAAHAPPRPTAEPAERRRAAR